MRFRITALTTALGLTLALLGSPAGVAHAEGDGPDTDLIQTISQQPGAATPAPSNPAPPVGCEGDGPIASCVNVGGD